ncbi:ABC transporter permease [soil metagenome]
MLVALILFVSIADEDFFSVPSLRTLAESAAPLLVLATGVTIVILCGGIDLSIAALASFTSVLFALWVPHLGLFAAVPVVAVAALAGAVQGVVHVVTQVPSFVVTLGGMALWGGIALSVSGATTISVTDRAVVRWSTERILGLPVLVLAALAIVGFVAATMQLTPFGRWVRAVGNSEPAALLAGLPVLWVKITAFSASGACAGLAALMLVSRNYAGAPRLADSLLLPAVAAIVVGGTAITGGHGGLGRTIVGVLIIGVLRVGLSSTGVDQAWEQIIYGSLIIGAVAVTIDRSKLSALK